MAKLVQVRIKKTGELLTVRSYGMGVVRPNGDFYHRSEYRVVQPLPSPEEIAKGHDPNVKVDGVHSKLRVLRSKGV